MYFQFGSRHENVFRLDVICAEITDGSPPYIMYKGLTCFSENLQVTRLYTRMVTFEGCCYEIDGYMEDCSNSIANALLLQSCTKR